MKRKPPVSTPAAPMVPARPAGPKMAPQQQPQPGSTAHKFTPPPSATLPAHAAAVAPMVAHVAQHQSKVNAGNMGLGVSNRSGGKC